jgi:hypothetical protein
MKAIIKTQQVKNAVELFNPNFYYCIFPTYEQDVILKSDDGKVEIDMRINSMNGFVFPSNCDLEVELKITATPKQPSPITKIVK